MGQIMSIYFSMIVQNAKDMLVGNTLTLLCFHANMKIEEGGINLNKEPKTRDPI